jgi:protein-S-isoprenylcysteine O-methyltransferase Ste14
MVSLSLLIIIAPLILALLILYVKFIEEKALEARFGEAYVNYKKKKSFIIPNFFQKQD